MTTFLPTGGGTYRLSGSIGSTDTSITLSSFLEPVSLTAYTMALMNTDIAYGTLEPQSARAEFISFTGITQNTDGTAILTGVTRGLAKSSPFASSTTFKLPHAGQSIFILSNTPEMMNEYATKRGAETLTNKRITKRVYSITSSATPTFNTDSYDCVSITALATAITSMSSGLTGTPTDFDHLIIRILDNGTSHAITWGASFVAKGTALPVTTSPSKLLTVFLEYDSVLGKWGCLSSQQEI